MAMMFDAKKVTAFEDWYEGYQEDPHTGCLKYRAMSPCASGIFRRYEHYKREMDRRVADFYKLELLADAEVISRKPDLPNVSSGEVAGLVRRIARMLVQNTPNVEVISEFDDDSVNGVLSSYILRSQIIGTDKYSNDMQQNLYASVKTSLTLGFDAVVPVLCQQPGGGWIIEYNPIHYRDVFPEPGATDVRRATQVFVRRYLTKGEIEQLIRDQVSGWDHAALRELLRARPTPPPRDRQSNPLNDTKRSAIAEGYEIITWYSNTGDPFLTFCGFTKMLLRIENNKHPLKQHPVFFLVLEKDAQHPLGKSQVELVLGRQEFQDLMHNGAMKLWYRNINPSIIGYGTVNATPNLSPGKYTTIPNPNARIETFEVNTQTLLQYGAISQNNLGAMVNLMGSADQQMATQAGNGMSATPQGVEAQQAMVDITTNNYQKAIESFFSHYCSYALTIYFQELSGVTKLTPNADSRRKLINAGLDPALFDEAGQLEASFKQMGVEYFVRCVPGSLVEIEDEKQMRILNELFVPLSQAMPALAQTGDTQMLTNAAQTLMYIVQKEVELSGSNRSGDLKSLLNTGRTQQFDQYMTRSQELEDGINGVITQNLESQELNKQILEQLQEQIKILSQTQGALLGKLGVSNDTSEQAAPRLQPLESAPTL